MKRKKIAGVLILSLVIAGCSGLSPSDRSPGITTNETPAETEQESVTTTTTPKQTSTEKRTPQKGDELLSVSRIDNSSAMEFNESNRVSYENLSEKKKELFFRALQCDCNVHQNEFSFNDEERIQVVKYRGEYYYLRVTIV